MKAIFYFAMAIVFATTSTPAAAQWIKQQILGIPRTADGKADLSAAAPRMPDGKPDLSGMWQTNPGGYVINMTQDLDPVDIEPGAAAQYQRHLAEYAKNDPACFLPSGPRYYVTGIPKIIQTAGLIAILNDDLTYRQIFLDGRSLPKDPTPSFMGYSIGRWEGDTLVVESIGLNDRTLLDTGGHPHTEDLHITECFYRRDFGHIDHVVTFSDPALYAKPIIVPAPMQYVADDELIEFICRENERDYQHIGNVTNEKYQTTPAILAKYAGVYTIGPPAARSYRQLHITLSGEELWIDRTPFSWERTTNPLIPVAENIFEANLGRRLKFIAENGAVTHMVLEAPEPGAPDITAIREKLSEK
jgi:hypothetical protein